MSPPYHRAKAIRRLTIFAQIDVLGFERLEYELSADAIGLGLTPRFRPGLCSTGKLLSLVGARGFEPPTSSSRTMRATKLRHAPTEGARLQGLRMIAHDGRTGTSRLGGNQLGPLDVGPGARPVMADEEDPRCARPSIGSGSGRLRR